MRALPLALAVACATEPGGSDTGDTDPPAPDCFLEGSPRLEVAPESGTFGDAFEGMDVAVTIPPQGGAPYTPWIARVTGDGALNGGVRMVATASEAGTIIGDTSFDLSPICANVEPNDGWWMITGIHVRYWDYTVDELVGRTVDLHFSLQDVGGGPERAGGDLRIHLVEDDGPAPL